MSLYGRWRPRVFDDVIGQAPVVTTLRNALRHNRLAHAYLFVGPRGTGKTTLARLLAKAVNCTGAGDERPCGECDICRAVDTGRFLDLIEIDAASNRGVDQIRDLRERVALAPAQGRRKVYLIDEVHMLTTEAFNALLKTLEEPPAHVLFILATTNPEKVPETVVSRCQRHDLRRVSVADVTARLAQVAAGEGIAAEPAALAIIARRATGSLRDALGMLEQCAADGRLSAGQVRLMLDLLPVEAIADLVDVLLERQPGACLEAVDRLIAQGARPGALTAQLLEYLRELLVCGLTHHEQDADGAEGSGQRMRAQAVRLELRELLAWIGQLSEANATRGAPAGLDRLPLELALLRCALGAPPAGMPAPLPAETPAAAPAPVVVAPVAGDAPPAAKAGYPVAQALPEHLRTLGGLIENWPAAVLAPLRRLDRQAEGLLRSCRPAGMAEGRLTLVTRYEFHLRKLTQPGALDAVTRVLSAALGAPHTVDVYLENEWQVRCQAAGLDLPPDVVEAIAHDPVAHEIVALGGVLSRWEAAPAP